MPKQNYGYYGGPNCRFISHPRSNVGYYQRICSLCPGKAIYHVATKGYCRTHKANAIKHLKLREPYIERRNIEFDYLLDDKEGRLNYKDKLRGLKK